MEGWFPGGLSGHQLKGQAWDETAESQALSPVLKLPRASHPWPQSLSRLRRVWRRQPCGSASQEWGAPARDPMGGEREALGTRVGVGECEWVQLNFCF